MVCSYRFTCVAETACNLTKFTCNLQPCRIVGKLNCWHIFKNYYMDFNQIWQIGSLHKAFQFTSYDVSRPRGRRAVGRGPLLLKIAHRPMPFQSDIIKCPRPLGNVERGPFFLKTAKLLLTFQKW